MDTRRVDDYLKRLKRREKFLAERVDGKDVDKSHYDRAELTALQWLIRFAEDNIEQAAEHQVKWFNEVKNG
jgi:hypothetical protein